MRNKSVRVNHYLPLSQWREARDHSKKTGVPMAEIIRRALAEWLKSQKQGG
jgi:hypothetical protein